MRCAGQTSNKKHYINIREIVASRFLRLSPVQTFNELQILKNGYLSVTPFAKVEPYAFNAIYLYFQ